MNFDDAIDAVKRLGVTTALSQDELLELYSLYKQSTIGNINIDKPYIWNTVDRAKWNAWKSKECIHQDDAKQLYIQYVEHLLLTHNQLYD
jgi:diazepam-binding inhibitor (GABA receptor modulating acyl-CoA-binding protein)